MSTNKTGYRVIFSESSPNMGGQEWQLLQQMKALRASGVDVLLACRPGAKIEAHAAAMNLPVQTFAFRNSVHLPTIVGLRRLIGALRPTACICHSGHDTNNMAIAARAFTLHRPKLFRSKTYLAGRASAYSYNHLVDRTFTPSEYLRAGILANSRIDASKTQVIYPGVDFDKLDREREAALPPELAAWLAATHGALIVQVGMLRQEKGHIMMLEALAQARPHMPPIRFAIIGGGPERPAIERRAAELGLTDCLWIGELKSVAPIVARADLLVMPSLVEPLGMAQIEAAGLGIPVIATRVGGIPETIADHRTGLLVSPDAASLAEALAYALSNPETMRELAERARADVRTRFSVERNAEALQGLIGMAR